MSYLCPTCGCDDLEHQAPGHASPPPDPVEAVRDTPCPDGHGGRNGCISQGLAADVENAGYFCAARIRAAARGGTT